MFKPSCLSQHNSSKYYSTFTPHTMHVGLDGWVDNSHFNICKRESHLWLLSFGYFQISEALSAARHHRADRPDFQHLPLLPAHLYNSQNLHHECLSPYHFGSDQNVLTFGWMFSQYLRTTLTSGSLLKMFLFFPIFPTYNNLASLAGPVGLSHHFLWRFQFRCHWSDQPGSELLSHSPTHLGREKDDRHIYMSIFYSMNTWIKHWPDGV